MKRKTWNEFTYLAHPWIIFRHLIFLRRFSVLSVFFYLSLTYLSAKSILYFSSNPLTSTLLIFFYVFFDCKTSLTKYPACSPCNILIVKYKLSEFQLSCCANKTQPSGYPVIVCLKILLTASIEYQWTPKDLGFTHVGNGYANLLLF